MKYSNGGNVIYNVSEKGLRKTYKRYLSMVKKEPGLTIECYLEELFRSLKK